MCQFTGLAAEADPPRKREKYPLMKTATISRNTPGGDLPRWRHSRRVILISPC
jgi:hypothetical protein